MTQKLDMIVVGAIASILGLPVLVKKTYHGVDTTNSSKIKFLIDYFHNTIKGTKSLEYRI